MKPARLVAATCFVGSLALADTARGERAPTGEITAYDQPGFVTLDRASHESFSEVSAGMCFYEGDDPDFNVRIDLYGQYVVPSGAGGYASLPVSFVAYDNESETAIGNLELGGLYNLRATPRTGIALRGGLMLGTADDDLAGALVNASTAVARHTDIASIYPETTWLRLAVSSLHRSGRFFLRADAGIDFALDEPAGADVDPVARLNIGAGFTNGAVAVMGELVSVGTTGEVGNDDRFRHSVAASVRGGMGGGVQGFCAVVLPVDDDLAFFGVDFALIAGVRVPIDE